MANCRKAGPVWDFFLMLGSCGYIMSQRSPWCFRDWMSFLEGSYCLTVPSPYSDVPPLPQGWLCQEEHTWNPCSWEAGAWGVRVRGQLGQDCYKSQKRRQITTQLAASLGAEDNKRRTLTYFTDPRQPQAVKTALSWGTDLSLSLLCGQL